jgi:hypothetical protein
MDETAIELHAELDRLSLSQALLDFEVANARVTDLTQRLMDAADEIVALKGELDRRNADLLEAQKAHREMVESKTWKIAKMIEGFRRLLR